MDGRTWGMRNVELQGSHRAVLAGDGALAATWRAPLAGHSPDDVHELHQLSPTDESAPPSGAELCRRRSCCISAARQRTPVAPGRSRVRCSLIWSDGGQTDRSFSVDERLEAMHDSPSHSSASISQSLVKHSEAADLPSASVTWPRTSRVRNTWRVSIGGIGARRPGEWVGRTHPPAATSARSSRGRRATLHGRLWIAAALPGTWLRVRLRPAFGQANWKCRADAASRRRSTNCHRARCVL